MANQQLIDYIKNQIKLGRSEDVIKAMLKNNGWQEADIEEGFKVVLGQSVSMPSSPSSNIQTTFSSPNKLLFMIKYLSGISLIILVLLIFTMYLVGVSDISMWGVYILLSISTISILNIYLYNTKLSLIFKLIINVMGIPILILLLIIITIGIARIDEILFPHF